MGQQDLPFYMPGDGSGSMTGGPIDATNKQAVTVRRPRRNIEGGADSLTGQNREVYQPAVFLPHGYPGSIDRDSVPKELTSANWRPRSRVLPFEFAQSIVYLGIRLTTEAALVVPDRAPGYPTVSTNVVSG